MRKIQLCESRDKYADFELPQIRNAIDGCREHIIGLWYIDKIGKKYEGKNT